ncbi:MAG TPA: hypothetical protein DCY79_16325 [Planctomycetaceae bacterium]|nr:hypothetical protein [Blastopirellula sp.]MAR11165.1 hypothetical protein [Blastopirellula sp.]HAY81372.1 hypothetical protein [Planctomycetaceae bacterium]
MVVVPAKRLDGEAGVAGADEFACGIKRVSLFGFWLVAASEVLVAVRQPLAAALLVLAEAGPWLLYPCAAERLLVAGGGTLVDPNGESRCEDRNVGIGARQPLERIRHATHKLQ